MTSLYRFPVLTVPAPGAVKGVFKGFTVPAPGDLYIYTIGRA